jgi:serine/threonine protein kinase
LLTTFQQRTQAAGGYYNQKEVVAGGRGGTGVHVFMVFELMQQTLLDVLQQAPGGKLERETVRLIVYQMVKALDHMHTLNAVHRDIKPENMLLQKIPGGSRLKKGRGSLDYRAAVSLDRMGIRDNLVRPSLNGET